MVAIHVCHCNSDRVAAGALDDIISCHNFDVLLELDLNIGLYIFFCGRIVDSRGIRLFDQNIVKRRARYDVRVLEARFLKVTSAVWYAQAWHGNFPKQPLWQLEAWQGLGSAGPCGTP